MYANSVLIKVDFRANSGSRLHAALDPQFRYCIRLLDRLCVLLSQCQLRLARTLRTAGHLPLPYAYALVHPSGDSSLARRP